MLHIIKLFVYLQCPNNGSYTTPKEHRLTARRNIGLF